MHHIATSKDDNDDDGSGGMSNEVDDDGDGATVDGAMRFDDNDDNGSGTTGYEVDDYGKGATGDDDYDDDDGDDGDGTERQNNQIEACSLTFMRSMKRRNSNIIDQWDLIHCGVAAVRYTHCNPEVWISSFVSIYHHPMRMIPFADWCKKLESFMQAADSFNLITQSQKIDEYTLLPALWQAMPPVDKKTAVAIFSASSPIMLGVLIVAVH